MRHIQLFGIGFHVSNESIDVFRRKVLSGSNQAGLLYDDADRLEVRVRLLLLCNPTDATAEVEGIGC
jgi:hypothetical protein